MTFSLRTFLFPAKGKKQRIVPMSKADERDIAELHRRREERNAAANAARSAFVDGLRP